MKKKQKKSIKQRLNDFIFIAEPEKKQNKKPKIKENSIVNCNNTKCKHNKENKCNYPKGLFFCDGVK